MRPGAGAPSTVVLYSREGCHLCDEARERLLELGRLHGGFELHEVDIESEESLHRRLLELIPVIEVDGVRVCELGFDGNAVLARLATVEG